MLEEGGGLSGSVQRRRRLELVSMAKSKLKASEQLVKSLLFLPLLLFYGMEQTAEKALAEMSTAVAHDSLLDWPFCDKCF